MHTNEDLGRKCANIFPRLLIETRLVVICFVFFCFRFKAGGLRSKNFQSCSHRSQSFLKYISVSNSVTWILFSLFVFVFAAMGRYNTPAAKLKRNVKRAAHRAKQTDCVTENSAELVSAKADFAPAWRSISP